MKKISIIEVNYHCHWEYSSPDAVIKKHAPSNRFLRELSGEAEILLVKHMDYEGAGTSGNLRFRFFRRKNSFWLSPSGTHRFIAGEKPDVVLVPGFIFPLQVIRLRKKLGKRCIILLMHHAEVPFRRKRIFQKIADRSVNGYLFSAEALARPWLDAGIISSLSKCFVLPPASFDFTQQDKEHCKSLTGMGEGINFLWAGRLNANKDPLTVLSGIEQYFAIHDKGKLFMIFQENDQLEKVKEKISGSADLKDRVVLKGKVEHTELQTWYSAADCYISGSHYEGGSFALMEAMACGCVPVVTNIPASFTTTGNGKTGYLFKAGDAAELYNILSAITTDELKIKSDACIEHYKNELSPKAVARRMLQIIRSLQAK